jgi:hypothetical protein
MDRPNKYNKAPPQSKPSDAIEVAEQAIKDAIARGVSDLERAQIIKQLAKELGFTQRVLEKEWRKFAGAQHQAKPPPVDRDELYQRCRHIAENPQLLEDMADVVDQLGVVEDRQGVKATYLAATSRLAMNRSLSHLRRARRLAVRVTQSILSWTSFQPRASSSPSVAAQSLCLTTAATTSTP